MRREYREQAASGSTAADDCRGGHARPTRPRRWGSISKGVAMKRFAGFVCAALGLLFLVESARADFGSLHYGGYQPWWNIFAKRNHCMSAEEERLQRFWHDYYDAMRRYYGMLDSMDWVAYY